MATLIEVAIRSLLAPRRRGPAGPLEDLGPLGAVHGVADWTPTTYPPPPSAESAAPAHGILIWPTSTAAPYGWQGASPAAVALALADVDTLALRGLARPYVALSQSDGVWGAERDLADGHLVGGRYWYDPAYPEVVLSWAGRHIFVGRSLLFAAPPIGEGVAAEVICACIAREEGGLARLRVVCQDSRVRDYRVSLETREVGGAVLAQPEWWVSTDPGCEYDLGAWPPDPEVAPAGFYAPYDCGDSTYRWADDWASWADLVAWAIDSAGWVEAPHPVGVLAGGAWAPSGLDLSLWGAPVAVSGVSGYATDDTRAPLLGSHVSLGLVASTTSRSPCLYSDTTVVDGVTTTRTRGLTVPCCGGWDDEGVHHQYAVRIEWIVFDRTDWTGIETYSVVECPDFYLYRPGEERWSFRQRIGLGPTEGAITEIRAALLRDTHTWDEVLVLASADGSLKRPAGWAFEEAGGLHLPCQQWVGEWWQLALCLEAGRRNLGWGVTDPSLYLPGGGIDVCAVAAAGGAGTAVADLWWIPDAMRQQQREMAALECTWACTSAGGGGAMARAAWWPRGGMAPGWGGAVRSVGQGTGRDLAVLSGDGGPVVVATGGGAGEAVVEDYVAGRLYWGLYGPDRALLRSAYEAVVGGIAEVVRSPDGAVVATTRGVVGRSLLATIPGVASLVDVAGVSGAAGGADELSEGGAGLGLW